MYKTRRDFKFGTISLYSDRPISESLATCFDCDDLTSDFGPIAQHTRLNSVEPKGFQFRHAMHAIVSAVERAIGSKGFDAIHGGIDEKLHGHGPRHIDRVRLHGPGRSERRR